MGVVHRARDIERAEVVALKTMSRLDPGALLRFKREFRALADISHPNVVQLYELFSEGDFWFFTMELVDGCDFLTWIRLLALGAASLDGALRRPTDQAIGRPRSRDPRRAHRVLRGARPRPGEPADRAGRVPSCAGRSPFATKGACASALRQLAAGVSAIHAAGKLHRDIKPSNVMVTRGGRVVLLDFGVVGEYRAARAGDRVDEPIVGTPAYMSPEQAAFRRADARLGLVRSGRHPLRGAHEADARSRARRATCCSPSSSPLAVLPSDLVSGVAAGPREAVLDLLSVDPRRGRPPTRSSSACRARSTRRRRRRASSPSSAGAGMLGELHAAFEASLAGPPVVIDAPRTIGHGQERPGDALPARRGHAPRRARPVRPLLRARGGAVQGRRPGGRRAESMARAPARRRGLRRRCPRTCRPSRASSPCCANVRAVAERSEADVADRLELRRQAFAALKELLWSMAARRPLVVHVDDLQWGDADSVQLLEAILTAARASTAHAPLRPPERAGRVEPLPRRDARRTRAPGRRVLVPRRRGRPARDRRGAGARARPARSRRRPASTSSPPRRTAAPCSSRSWRGGRASGRGDRGRRRPIDRPRAT